MTNPRPPAGRPTSADKAQQPPDTRSLVQQIVTEQKQQKADLQAAINTGGRRANLGPFALIVLILANVVGWLVIPPKGDTGGDGRNPAQVERDLRLVIAAAASNIEVWRSVNGGVLPNSLSDAGVTDPGLSYVKVDSLVYEVRGEDRGATLQYRSNVAIGDFLDAGLGARR